LKIKVEINSFLLGSRFPSFDEVSSTPESDIIAGCDRNLRRGYSRKKLLDRGREGGILYSPLTEQSRAPFLLKAPVTEQFAPTL
jgi:hypothetical protein